MSYSFSELTFSSEFYRKQNKKQTKYEMIILREETQRSEVVRLHSSYLQAW